ncbi:MAG: FKBP-type peptidyl-prolyl cis-trans isomerase [Porticoccaceae bacterium]|nr:FKBP-type peptidyl-prolyl cis-trans isomerase [Porticoccaceae bacterium]
MKIVKILPMAMLFTLAACEQSADPATDAAATTVELSTLEQRVSYLMGMQSAASTAPIELDQAAYDLGFSDGLASNDPAISEEVIAETVTEFQAQMTAKQEEQQKQAAESMAVAAEGNLKEGTEFLAANGAKEGVVTTDSGLQYRVLTSGEGAVPTAESTVEVHYAGRLLDGTEFDSSIKRGVPAQFGVTQVIAGWTEALQLMAEGSKWELYIPADLAYGPGGTGPIGPNQTLIFEVELLKANISTEG